MSQCDANFGLLEIEKGHFVESDLSLFVTQKNLCVRFARFTLPDSQFYCYTKLYDSNSYGITWVKTKAGEAERLSMSKAWAKIGKMMHG